MIGNLDVMVSCYTENASKDARKAFELLKKRLKRYIPDEWAFSSFLYVSFPDNEEAILDIIELWKRYPSIIEVSIPDMWLEYDEKEAEMFPGFIPRFYDHYCEEYDDVEYIFETCEYCDSCYSFRESELWDGKSYGNVKLVSPDGYIRKTKDKCAVMNIDSIDGVDLISVPLRNELIQLGNNEGNFKSVVNKRGKTVAYEFQEDAILPVGAVVSERFIGTKKCPQCGRFNYGYEELTRESFQYRPYCIKKEYLDTLGSVSKTMDCYNSFPLMIVSPKIRKDIIKFCPEARFEPIQIL